MKLRQGNFFIITQDGLKKVNGWISDDGLFGFHKFNRQSSKTTYVWSATDIKSGRRIVTFSTRKACIKWIEDNGCKIVARWASGDYEEMKEDFERRVINGEINKDMA